MDNLDGLQSISLENAVQSSSSSSIQDKAIRFLMFEVATTVKKSAPGGGSPSIFKSGREHARRFKKAVVIRIE